MARAPFSLTARTRLLSQESIGISRDEIALDAAFPIVSYGFG
jgi:hypothetical protein